MRLATHIVLGVMLVAVSAAAWRWATASRPRGVHKAIGPILAANGPGIGLGALAASDRHLDTTGLRDLLDAVPASSLRTLRVASNELDAAAGLVLATHAKLIRLEHLTLDANLRFGPAGMRALGGAPWWATIEEFSATATGIDVGDAFEVIRGAPRLVSVGVGYNPVGDSVVPHLLACPALQSIDLRETRITGDGARAVLGHPGMALLLLDGTRLGPGALAAAGEVGARAVRAAHGSRSMSLDLKNTGLNAQDVEWLIATGLPVVSLSLSHNPIADAGLDALADAPLLDWLEALDLANVSASSESQARLRARWGHRPGLTL